MIPYSTNGRVKLRWINCFRVLVRKMFANLQELILAALVNLGKILANDVRFTKLAKVFPAKILHYMVHPCVCVCVCVWCVCISTCTWKYVYMCIDVCVCMCVYVYIHMYVHTYIHTYICTIKNTIFLILNSASK